jgi:hypothetical protein
MTRHSSFSNQLKSCFAQSSSMQEFLLAERTILMTSPRYCQMDTIGNSGSRKSRGSAPRPLVTAIRRIPGTSCMLIRASWMKISPTSKTLCVM